MLTTYIRPVRRLRMSGIRLHSLYMPPCRDQGEKLNVFIVSVICCNCGGGGVYRKLGPPAPVDWSQTQDIPLRHMMQQVPSTVQHKSFSGEVRRSEPASRLASCSVGGVGRCVHVRRLYVTATMIMIDLICTNVCTCIYEYNIT